MVKQQFECNIYVCRETTTGKQQQNNWSGSKKKFLKQNNSRLLVKAATRNEQTTNTLPVSLQSLQSLWRFDWKYTRDRKRWQHYMPEQCRNHQWKYEKVCWTDKLLLLFVWCELQQSPPSNGIRGIFFITATLEWIWSAKVYVWRNDNLTHHKHTAITQCIGRPVGLAGRRQANARVSRSNE